MTEADIREFLRRDYGRLVDALAMVADSRAAAEDAVQEALARAWERSERGVEIGSLAGWVRVAALNLLRSRLRRLATELRARTRLASAAATAADLDEPFGDDVAASVRALPQRQREVVVLHYVLDLSVADVAGGLGLSEGTVKTCLHRARAALAASFGLADSEEVTARG